MNFNIYYYNHGKQSGVEDYYAILKTIIIRHGYQVDITDTLNEKAINIVIDEFTNLICNKEIVEFKTNYPNSKLYYILTEFIEEKLFIKSFNFFGGLMDAAPLAAMNIFFRIRRKDFNSPKLNDWLIATLYFPLMVVYYLKHWIKNLCSQEKILLRRRLHTLAYMKMRYLGLEKMLQLANGVILSHGMIEHGLRTLDKDIWVIGTFYPEIDESDYELIKKSLFKNKVLGIEITGSITPFRQSYIEKINLDIVIAGLKNMFKKCKVISFSDSPKNIRTAYSLHPPQTAFWKYSSPTRIYRALTYDYNIPILTKDFNQHPIEKLCLKFKNEETLVEMHDFYKTPEKFINFFDPKIMEYMEISKKENNKIISKIIEDNKLN